MNKNLLIVLAGAVLVAILVAVLMQVILGTKKDVPVVEEPKVELLVAAKDLSTGRELRDGDIKWQQWPKSSVFPGAITRKDNEDPLAALEKDSRLARDLAEGEPLIVTALIGDAKGNFVAASLTPGNRAVAVEVNASSMVAGFVSPGDYVDVLLTYKDSAQIEDDDPQAQAMMQRNLKKLAAETILQNVRVLAVDQATNRPEDGKAKIAKTVTLDLSLQDSERLALAQTLGELTLALRGIGDDTVVDRQWPTITDSRLTTIDDEIYQEYGKLKGDPGMLGGTVRVYNGAEVVDVLSK